MPANPLSEIPLIDIGPYFAGGRADKKLVADEISRACERIGFFVVSGHGVAPALVEGVQRESKAFFARPLEEKLTIRQRKEQKGSRGYEPVGTEQLSATIGVETPPDLKESLSSRAARGARTIRPAAPRRPHPSTGPTCGPQNPATLRPTCEAYIRALDRLSQHLHRLAAIAFDLPEDHFEDKIDRGFSILRVLNYPDQREDPEEGQLRAGEHSDYDNLTICLIEDKPGGLQARGPDGNWVDVPVRRRVVRGQYRRLPDALDERSLEVHTASRGQPAAHGRGAPLRLPLHHAQPRCADRVSADLPEPGAPCEISADRRWRLHDREICQPGER